MSEAPKCPTCGRTYPVNPSPKYASEEERLEAVRALNAARIARKVARDVETVLPLLPDPFTVGDVGHAVEARGRHWSESQSVLARWINAGVVVLVGRHAGGRRTRLFRSQEAIDREHAESQSRG